MPPENRTRATLSTEDFVPRRGATASHENRTNSYFGYAIAILALAFVGYFAYVYYMPISTFPQVITQSTVPVIPATPPPVIAPAVPKAATTP